jgi:hypothetical protein
MLSTIGGAIGSVRGAVAGAEDRLGPAGEPVLGGP